MNTSGELDHAQNQAEPENQAGLVLGPGPNQKKKFQFFFKKSNPPQCPERARNGNVKGQPDGSTNVREKGGVTYHTNRETPCSMAGLGKPKVGYMIIGEGYMPDCLVPKKLHSFCKILGKFNSFCRYCRGGLTKVGWEREDKVALQLPFLCELHQSGTCSLFVFEVLPEHLLNFPLLLLAVLTSRSPTIQERFGIALS